MFIGIGLTAEISAKRFFLLKYFQIDFSAVRSMGQVDRFKASLINELPDFIGLCLFFGTAYSAYFIFQSIDSAVMQLTFLSILISVSLIRILSICSKLLLSPNIPSFRVLPIDCEMAGKAHRLVLYILSYIIAAMMFSVVTLKLGAQPQTVSLLHLLFTTLLLAVTGGAIFMYKNRIKNYIVTQADDESKTRWGAVQFASVWHILAILYLLLLWALLVADIANPEEKSNGAFLLSFFVVPVWMIADRLIQWIVVYSMKTLKIHQNQYEDKGDVNEEILLARTKGRLFYLKIKGMARSGTAIILGIWLAGLWNIEIPFLSDVAGVVLDTIIILTIALFFWQFISAWMEKKIEESNPDADEKAEEDDEWGGAAKMGRSYTLLPMIRKFIASVLVVLVTLTILSSFGVDIGPLLAGAGVIGLAVGFGAQKLVSDMFSGFFYLFDDAFRVGEYIKANAVSGSVEAITLRNVMLRHHRGMLQIVPHSNLGAITNFMRGGITVKFSLDFPYDANIDKIRKIIKKVGKSMLADEGIGKDFIKPLKSQGVRQISNSIMTIRAKFTAQPGTHFVIRREAYKRVTEALSAKGIHYAHKKVIVDVPVDVSMGAKDESRPKLSNEQLQKQILSTGAASLAAINEDEDQALKEASKGPDNKEV